MGTELCVWVKQHALTHWCTSECGDVCLRLYVGYIRVNVLRVSMCRLRVTYYVSLCVGCVLTYYVFLRVGYVSYVFLCVGYVLRINVLRFSMCRLLVTC